jgi:D-alanyl-D-alanine dipeptidase
MPGQQKSSRVVGSAWVRSGVGVLALALSSCAMLPPQGAAGQGAAGQGAAGQGAAGQGAAQASTGSEIAAVLSQPECRRLAGQRAQLQAVQDTLARQGMALRVLGCPQLASGARGAAAQQVLAVAVLVVDGERAAQTVRGPLADGELLDMGSAVPQAATGLAQRVSSASLAQPPDDALSPDVLFNRAWLRALMGRQGLRAVPGTWWAFTAR